MVSRQSKPTVLRPILHTGGKTRLCIVDFTNASILETESISIPVFEEMTDIGVWRSKPSNILSSVL